MPPDLPQFSVCDLSRFDTVGKRQTESIAGFLTVFFSGRVASGSGVFNHFRY